MPALTRAQVPNRIARLVSVLAFLVALSAAGASQAQLYLDRAGFENALGSAIAQEEDFESLPLDGDGFDAGSNGASYGGGAFTWASMSLGTDVIDFNSLDSGRDGTVLFYDATGAGETTTSVVGHPGGEGSGSVPEADDLRLDFTTPVAAAGLRIYNNSPAAGETVEFRDE